jgi:hypothetical protein
MQNQTAMDVVRPAIVPGMVLDMLLSAHEFEIIQGGK